MICNKRKICDDKTKNNCIISSSNERRLYVEKYILYITHPITDMMHMSAVNKEMLSLSLHAIKPRCELRITMQLQKRCTASIYKRL